jgi:iron complex transport system ATP-binding protein
MRIEVVAASAGYGERAALTDVSFAVGSGTVTVVLGANGAGKSTLVRLLAGLVPPRSGSVAVGGLDVGAASRRELARAVALVPQRVEVPVGFTVREVVAMGRAPHQDGWHRVTDVDRGLIQESLESCDLKVLADRPLDTLSGGEQQRVHVARALAQAAPVLLLDEAAANLDIRQSAAQGRLVRRLVQERRLVCVAAMHDLNAAARLADRVLLLREGRTVAEGPPGEVMTAELLERTFGVPVQIARRDDGSPMFSAA